MNTEDKTYMPITLYRDEDGNPTCAKDFPTGKVCIFYATQKLGCWETCWFSGKDGKKWDQLVRRKRGVGSLIPSQECPLWLWVGNENDE